MADLTFAHYYQTELAYYRALAQSFGERYPEVAHLVAERGGDEAAERLFEGAALLTARLRQRIDDDLPEIAHPVFARLWPQYLRPLPAVSLLQLTPVQNAVRQSQLVPRGTLVRSGPVEPSPGAPERVSCPFQTTAPIDLNPLRIEEAGLIRPQAGDLQVRVRLRLSGANRFDDARLRRLRLQLLGDEETRFTLYDWLARQAHRVTLQTPDGEVCLTLPRARIRPVGMTPEESLCPGAPTPIPGLDLLREYFVLPDKFLGVEVSGLEAVPKEALADCFDCVFHLGPLPDPGVAVGTENLALGCVPVVNLSESHKIDLPVPTGTHRFRLELAHGGQVYEIDRVRAFDGARGDWVEYRHLLDIGIASPGQRQPCYMVLRRLDGVDGIQTYLAITDEEGRAMAAPTDSLQVWFRSSDGTLPLRLGPGSLETATPSSPEFATFTNVLPVTPGESLKLDRDRLWHVLAELAMHPDDLCSLNGLQLLLREAQGEHAAQGGGPELREARCSFSSTLYRRTVVPLRSVELSFAERSFVAPGQLYLLASLLSRLFAPLPGSTLFTEVAVRGEPSGVTHRFSLAPQG